MCATSAKNRGRPVVWTTACLVAIGAGAALWWWWPPVPPEIPHEGLDVEVALAIEEARAAVLAAPRSGEAWGALGRVLLANEVFPDIGLVCFARAEQLDADNPRWPYFAAGLLLRQGKRDEATTKLERTVALCEAADLRHAAPRMLLAETLVASGQSEMAEPQFKHALRNDPNDPRAHFDLGMLAAARGDWPTCRTHLEACLGTPQARKKACVQLATVCERLGDSKNAQHYANLAARLPKDFDWTDPFVAEHAHLAKRKRDRYRVVEQLEAEGRLAHAANILGSLLAAYPDDDLPHLMMGRVLAQLGQYPPALEHLHKARKLAPEKVQVYYLLSLTLFRRGEALSSAKDGDRKQARALFEEAVHFAGETLARRPDYGSAHMSMGLALKHLDRKAESLAAFREAVHCNPEHAENHLFLGIALAEEGQLAEARPILEQARLLSHPDDPRPSAALNKYFPKAAPKAGP